MLISGIRPSEFGPGPPWPVGGRCRPWATAGARRLPWTAAGSRGRPRAAVGGDRRPPAAVQPIHVSVGGLDGFSASAATLTYYDDAPMVPGKGPTVVSSLSPDHGPIGGTTLVVARGANFAPTGRVDDVQTGLLAVVISFLLAALVFTKANRALVSNPETL